MTQLKELAGARLDVRKYLQYYEIGLKEVKLTDDGRTSYVLSRCPFDPSHQGKDAAIFQDDNGKLGAKCFHDSCAGKGWAEFRNAIGPIRFKEHMIGGGQRGALSLPGSPYRRPDSKAFDLEIVSNADLFDDKTELRFLVQDVLVAEQPCTLGGSSKTLKTSLAVDMAVSVAAKQLWLGHFPVLENGGVFIVSAESGKPVLRDQMKAVCKTKKLSEEEARALDIRWSFRRPQLANLAHLNVLGKTLEEFKPKLVILDPSYLLISGAGADSTKNLFAMGEVLGGIAETIAGACGGTLMLLHHVNKSAARAGKGGTLPLISLGDLAYAGFVEWTRQWILLSRVVPYAEGSGKHDLHMSAGGSAGHSGSWSINIDEGKPMDQTVGRRWEPAVMSVEAGEEKRQAKEASGVEARIMTMFNGDKEVELNEIKERGGLKGKELSDTLERLVSEGKLTEPRTGVYQKGVDLGGQKPSHATL